MRINTIAVDVSVVPVRPKATVIEKFLLEQLHLDVKFVRTVQLHNVRNCVYIEFHSKEIAEDFAATHHLKHTMECNKSLYKIPVYVDDGATNVRVHDVPPQTANDVIVTHLSRYGEVITIANEMWRNLFIGLPNGVRIARMKLSQPIPSYIQIGDETTLVTYKNQLSTCRHCGLRVHRDMKCSEAAALQKQQHPHPQQQQQQLLQQQQQQQQQVQHQQQRPQQAQRQKRKPSPQQQQQQQKRQQQEQFPHPQKQLRQLVPPNKTDNSNVIVDRSGTANERMEYSKHLDKIESHLESNAVIETDISDMESIEADDVHLLSTSDFLEWIDGAKKYKTKKKTK